MFCCVVVGFKLRNSIVALHRTLPSHPTQSYFVTICVTICVNCMEGWKWIQMTRLHEKKRRCYHTFSSSPLSLEPQGWGATVPGYPQASGHRVAVSGNCVAFNLHVCWHQGRREHKNVARVARSFLTKLYCDRSTDMMYGLFATPARTHFFPSCSTRIFWTYAKMDLVHVLSSCSIRIWERNNIIFGVTAHNTNIIIFSSVSIVASSFGQHGNSLP